jgi:hypothetical protein
MSNYVESKKALDKIRDKYGCKGEVLFRTSIQYVVDCGQQNFQDENWVKEQLEITDKRHDAFEREKKNPFISREFEKALIECAAEIAKVNTYDLLIYIQREVWLDGDGIDYQRAIELLKKCIYDIEERENCEDKLLVQALDNIGFYDSEIEELGFGYLFNNKEEDE